MNRLEEIVKILKTHIGESVEVALDYLEQVLAHDSMRYNDFIQIKSRYNSLQRELLLGVLDHSTYDISRNNISKALLLLAEEITEKDLVPEGGVKTQEEDKRGEVLYHIPDVMQHNHEEKCTVRIAFDIEHVKRDWEESKEDVIKSIRVSEIMAVSLLNVDESDPPFTIRSFSETVQFVDKDDFTEWVFYVKPVKIGRFPLLMRVSVIEMINNKEYKKDIVLEEEITVQTEEVPAPETAAFKSAGTSIVLNNNPLPPEEIAPPVAQAQEAGKKGLKRIAGALLTAAALAASGWFGYQYIQQEQDYKKAQKSGKVEDYRRYLEKHPDGRYEDEVRNILDSLLNYKLDSMPGVPDSEILPAPDTLTSAAPAPVDSAATDAGATTPQSDGVATNSTPDKKERGVQKKKTDKKKKTVQPPVQEVGKQITPVTQPEPPKATLPPPVNTEPLLRGNHFYFKIPRFAIVEQEQQYLGFTFFQFNEHRDMLAILSSLGQAKLLLGKRLAFVPEKGDAIVTKLIYVSETPDVKNRSDGYFILSAEDLGRLANEKFKAVRLIDVDGKTAKKFNFTHSGSKNLNRRANEALKKIEERQ